jgi:ribose 5-phosphate isomerase B
MRVYVGTDHAGFELKNALVAHLREQGHDVVDVGAHAYDPQDDYPGYCIETGRRVVADDGSVGVVIGGSGNGEQIAANKVRGVRAALTWNTDTATLARQHNNANVVSIGARMHDESTAIGLVEAFLGTPFSHDPRHQRRIDEVAGYEAEPAPPGLPG